MQGPREIFLAGTTSQKRQKEMKRRERQQMKAEKRAERKRTKTVEQQAAASPEFDKAVITLSAGRELDHEV